MVGPSIGPYRILERLGAGGMGEVYLAEDPRLKRQVAIKTVAENRLGDPDARRLLLREARAAANLSHPNIAAIYDILESDGRAHIVMEYVPGETLAAAVARGPLGPARALEIGLQLADALEAAHALGIVHRDLKPHNVVLTPAAKAKVLDFGLAKRSAADDAEPSSSAEITPAGFQVAGTPQYMSPEQLKGKPVDARSDLYSFGVVLFEMLTGKRPYQGRDPQLLLTAILSEPPPSARALNPGVPAELDAIASRAMAREPADRYSSATTLRADLARAAASLDEISTLSDAARIRSGVFPAWTRGRLALAVLPVLALAAGLRWLPSLARPSTRVPADAARWYEQGTAALREGSYLTAAKRLEQAVALHDAYPLAHARLAEARAELDDDRAKDSLLYVQKLVPDLSRLPKDDALYLEGIRAMVTRRFGDAIRAYAELAGRFPSESHVQFDLGRAHEANDEHAKAIACYEMAAQLDPSSPAPHLRLGELRGQKQQLDAALASFRQAESLYQAASNLEGVTEVACRRGTLYNTLDRSKEARIELERALKLAAETENTHQRIRALLQLSGVAATEGATDEAEKHASEAMTLARGMDGLTASSLSDLGNVFFVRGEDEQAERYFQEALAAARRLRAQRAEARALLSLASLRIRQGNTEEAMPFLNGASRFYQQGGFPKLESVTYMLLGEAHDIRGEFQAAVEALEKQLRIARDLGDEALLAQAELLLGLALLRWERLPAALEHLESAETTFRKLGHNNLAYCLANQAEVLLRLGRVPRANTVVRELRRLSLAQPEGLAPIRSRIAILTAAVSAARGSFQPAASDLESVLADPAADEAFKAEAASELALLRERLGSRREAQKLARDGLERARRLGDPVLTVRALLTLSAVLIGDQPGQALDAAREPLAEADLRGFLVSGWQAAVLAARAAALSGSSEAPSLERRAADRLSQLRIQFGEAAVDDLMRSPGMTRPARETSRPGVR